MGRICPARRGGFAITMVMPGHRTDASAGDGIAFEVDDIEAPVAALPERGVRQLDAAQGHAPFARRPPANTPAPAIELRAYPL